LADGSVVEFWLNVILFVPLGALSALIWPRIRLWGWALAGLLLSSTLEWIQLQMLSERSSTSRDIIANTLGMALGAGLVWTVRWLSAPGWASVASPIGPRVSQRAFASCRSLMVWASGA
jgi:glycopeptide antibiotics resistance protein